MADLLTAGHWTAPTTTNHTRRHRHGGHWTAQEYAFGPSKWHKTSLTYRYRAGHRRRSLWGMKARASSEFRARMHAMERAYPNFCRQMLLVCLTPIINHGQTLLY